MWQSWVRTLFGSPGRWRNGRTFLPGLRDNVEILTDRNGVPHIYAGDFLDLYFAQGYVHARERLWQLEMNRRVGQGRLAEIFGEPALTADRFLRRMGLEEATERHWKILDPTAKSYLSAYAAGVNAGAMGQTPLEFRLLRLKPKPWLAQDSLLWSKVMAMDMGSNWECELMRARLLEALGPETAALFHLHYPEGQPTASGGAWHQLLDGLDKLYRDALPWLGQSFGRFAGSNAWAVSGERSESGKPLLASDPHVLVRLPSTWYEVHLQVGDWWVYGVSLAGLPGIMLGQNKNVAWGITNAYVDSQDLAVEEIRDGRVRTAEGWAVPTVRHETIQVKGKPAVTEEVWVTPNGPLLYREENRGLAMRWTGYDVAGDTTVEAIFALNGARNTAEMQKAWALWRCPCLNFVYATTEGDFGYQLAGAVPVRAGGQGLTPVPGYDSAYAWTGTLAFEQLPHKRNPACGYVVSANNQLTDQDYPHFLGLDFMAGFRASRIEQLLQARPTHAPCDFSRYQTDLLCLPGLRWAQLCKDLQPSTEVARQALQQIRDWAGLASPDSVAACIYEAWLLHACRRAFGARLGERLLEMWMAGAHSPMAVMGPHGGRYVSFVLEAAERNDVRLLPESTTWTQVLLSSLDDTTQDLTQRLGPDVDEWQWGRLHTLQLQHALGAVPALAPIFNSGTVPYGGDTDTVSQSAVIPHKPYGVECWAPSWRLVVDLHSPERGSSILPSGQSGWPGDRHYLDHFARWQEGTLHPTLVSRGDLERTRPRRLVLIPKGRA